jgi:hypothetical protein
MRRNLSEAPLWAVRDFPDCTDPLTADIGGCVHRTDSAERSLLAGRRRKEFINSSALMDRL